MYLVLNFLSQFWGSLQPSTPSLARCIGLAGSHPSRCRDAICIRSVSSGIYLRLVANFLARLPRNNPPGSHGNSSTIVVLPSYVLGTGMKLATNEIIPSPRGVGVLLDLPFGSPAAIPSQRSGIGSRGGYMLNREDTLATFLTTFSEQVRPKERKH